MKQGANFGEVVGAIARIRRSESDGYEDMTLFNAPSECGSIISAQARRKELAILNSYELTAKEYNEELRDRTSPKWAYFSGLSVEEPFEEEEMPPVEDLELGGGWRMSAADWAAEKGNPPAEDVWAQLEQMEAELYARAAAEGRLDSGAESLMTEEHRELAAELREVDEKRYSAIVDEVWA